MSSEQDRVREMAERVARRLTEGAPPGGEAGARAETRGGELNALHSSLSDIQRRLAHIESHLAEEGDCEHDGRAEERPPTHPSPAVAAQEPTRSMWLSGTYVPAVPVASHPSQERFNDIGEAVSELVEFFEREKTCTVEPGGKPCDHCGLCSSRGF
jgi:hypothetical protein